MLELARGAFNFYLRFLSPVVLKRWLGEPVRLVMLSTDIFLTNAKVRLFVAINSGHFRHIFLAGISRVVKGPPSLHE